MAATGHPVRVSSLAHWRMNEPRHQNYGTLFDTGTEGLDLTETVGTHHIMSGPSGKQYAKYFDAAFFFRSTSVPGPSARATFTTSPTWTFECWLYPEFVGTASKYLWGICGQDDSSSATNHLVSIAFNQFGIPFCFFENGTGTDRLAQQASGDVMVEDEWQHLAVSRNGSTWKFYRNGVQQGPDVTQAEVPTNGTDTRVVVGNFERNSPNQAFDGRIFEIRVSDVVRSDADILASFENEAHVLDGDALFFYAFNEPPAITDDTDNGFHLRATDNARYVLSEPIVQSGGSAIATQGIEFEHRERAELLAALKADFTFGCWVRSENFAAGEVRGLWLHGNPGPETEVENFFGLEIADSDLQSFSEHGAGLDSTFTSSGAGLAQFKRHHVAQVVEYTGANYVVSLYLDGLLVGTSGSLVGLTGGGNGFFRLCNGPGEAPLEGVLDDVALYTEALDAATILEIYNAGLSPLDLDANAPVISGLTPADGAELASRTTPIEFDITDVLPGIAELIVTAQYVGADQPMFVVHDGTAFQPPFDGLGSTRTPITDGFHYAVVPTGGWSFDISELRVRAVDAHGNVIAP